MNITYIRRLTNKYRGCMPDVMGPIYSSVNYRCAAAAAESNPISCSACYLPYIIL
jgi:hypothetical protein